MRVVAKPIEMVAWFSADGLPNPVRFRLINDDCESFTTIKVDRIITRDKEKLAGNNMLVFKCQSVINNIDHVYEIKYELLTCKWILFKM